MHGDEEICFNELIRFSLRWLYEREESQGGYFWMKPDKFETINILTG